MLMASIMNLRGTMRISKEHRARVKTQGLEGLFNVIEDESFRLTGKLKLANDIDEVRKLQGAITTLEDLIKLKSSN